MDGGLQIDGLTEVEAIGAGGFADVYRARQARFARMVAVKVLRATDLDETARSRFERECQALGTLSTHPGIVTVYDGGFTGDGRPYLMMEYYPNGSLEDRIRQSGPLGWSESARLGETLADSLAAAHRAQIVHRDIKPANVLVGEHGNPPPAPVQPVAGYAAPYAYPVAQPAYAVPVPVATSRPNGLATASLVLSILWLCWLGSLLGILFGAIALNQINRSQGTQTGSGQAWAGIVIGAVGVLALIVLAAGGTSTTN